MAKKETCPRCGHDKFAKAQDKSNKHYCDKCKHVWVPGFDQLTRPDLLLKKEQQENIELKAEILKLRKENAELLAKLNPPVESEIFD